MSVGAIPVEALGGDRVVTGTSTSEPVAAPLPTPAVTPAKKAPMAKNKKASNETVLARARQMARAEKRKIWAALGFEGDFDEVKFTENVEQLAAAKSASKSTTEVLGSKAKEVEAENARLKAKLHDATKKLAQAAKELEQKKAEVDDVKIEHEIQREAAARGIVDLDYATDLYRRAVKTAPENAEPPAVGAFFEELKKDSKRKHLFGAVEGRSPSSDPEAGRSGSAGGVRLDEVVPEGVPGPPPTELRLRSRIVIRTEASRPGGC